jgi:hypothetical protein
MPLYLDVHKHVDGVTEAAVAAAHLQDLETQGQCTARRTASSQTRSTK